MNRKSFVSALTLALTASTALAGCSSSGSSASTASTTAASTVAGTDTSTAVINYGMSTAWDSLNPYGSASGSIYQQLVCDALYDRLAFVDEAGTGVEPRGAKSWESSEDGMSATFYLDENATWHDGEPVTANDWVWTFQTVCDPSFEWGMKSEFKFLAGTDDTGNCSDMSTLGVSAPDDYTLVLTFKNAMPVEDWILLHNKYVYVLPQHLLGDLDPSEINSSDFWENPIGSGPCTFVSELTGSQLELATYQDYHLGAPQFGKLVFTVIANSNLVNSFMSGEIDAYSGSTTVDELAAAETQGYTITKSALPTGVAVFLINNRKITDKRIRQAMSYAMDKELLIEQAVNGEGVASATCIIPGSDWDNGLTWEHDPEKAKALLEEAGWDSSQTLTLAITSARASAAAIIQQNFADVGINIEIETVDFATMTAGLEDDTYDLGICGTSAMNYPLWMQGYYDYRNATYCNIQDTYYAELQEQISSEMDETNKKALVDEYQNYLYDQMPLIIMYHSYSSAIEPKRLQNYNPFEASMNNQKIWEWTVSE